MNTPPHKPQVGSLELKNSILLSNKLTDVVARSVIIPESYIVVQSTYGCSMIVHCSLERNFILTCNDVFNYLSERIQVNLLGFLGGGFFMLLLFYSQLFAFRCFSSHTNLTISGHIPTYF